MIPAHLKQSLLIALLITAVTLTIGCGGSGGAVPANAPIRSSPSPSPSPTPTPAPTPTPTVSPSPSEFLLEGNSRSSLNLAQIDVSIGSLGPATSAPSSFSAADNFVYPGV